MLCLLSVHMGGDISLLVFCTVSEVPVSFMGQLSVAGGWS